MRKLLLLPLLLLCVGCATCPVTGPAMFTISDAAATAAQAGPVGLAVAGGLIAAELAQYAMCP